MNGLPQHSIPKTKEYPEYRIDAIGFSVCFAKTES
jgi:hypothetical protein